MTDKPTTPAAPEGAPTHGVRYVRPDAGNALIAYGPEGRSTVWVPASALLPLLSPDPLAEARAKVVEAAKVYRYALIRGTVEYQRIAKVTLDAAIDALLAAEHAQAKPVDPVRELVEAADALIYDVAQHAAADAHFDNDPEYAGVYRKTRDQKERSRTRYAAAKAALLGKDQP
jgi:hypothetical protein